MSGPASAPSTAERRLSWSSLESRDTLEELARFVRQGGVVVFPTESSYALGADPTNPVGVAAVFRIKNRRADKPLPVVVAGPEALEALGVEPPVEGLSVLAKAWPGPLTMILPLRKTLPAASGRTELAVRVPGHRRLRALLARLGCALTATSANLAGEAPLLDAADVDDLVGQAPMWIIDEGRLRGGSPSTLVRMAGNRVTVLRRGAVEIDRLRELAPQLVFDDDFSATAVEIPADGGG